MPVTYRPGWHYPSDAGRMSEEVVAYSDDVVATSIDDARTWLNTLLDAVPFDQIIQYCVGTVQVSKVVVT